MALMFWNLFKRSATKPTGKSRTDGSRARTSANLGGATKGEKPTEPSFDPYNSGAFQRKKNAWDKVVRK